MGNIKSRLVLECSEENIFLEFCKFINAFTNDVECLHFVNKNYIIYKNNEKIYKSQVIFRLQKFSSLIFIWKTLCSWNKISDKNITFQLLANIKNERFMEFNNDVITLDTHKKPKNFDLYFIQSKYQSKHVEFYNRHHNENE
jgi:hypothetical protein